MGTHKQTQRGRGREVLAGQGRWRRPRQGVPHWRWVGREGQVEMTGAARQDFLGYSTNVFPNRIAALANQSRPNRFVLAMPLFGGCSPIKPSPLRIPRRSLLKGKGFSQGPGGVLRTGWENVLAVLPWGGGFQTFQHFAPKFFLVQPKMCQGRMPFRRRVHPH